MKPTLISVLGVILTHGGARAQTVTQPVDRSSVSTGAPVQVNCSYSFSGSPLLFWYVRYPGSSLQLLLGYTTGKSTNGFTADLNKAETSFHLKKASAQEEDSATYYCALSGTVPAFAREAEHKPLRGFRTFVSSLLDVGVEFSSWLTLTSCQLATD